MAPAALLTQNVQIPNLHLENATGSVWQGRADALVQNKPIGAVHWRVDVFELLRSTLVVDFSMQGDGLELNGALAVDPNERNLTLAGLIDSQVINLFTLAYDIRMSETIHLNSVKIAVTKEQKLTQAQGSMTWQGGPVHFILMNEMHNVKVAPTRGVVSKNEDSLILTVLQQTKDDPVLEFRLELTSGWLNVRAFQPFIEYAGLPTNYVRRSPDFLFEVSQKIF